MKNINARVSQQTIAALGQRFGKGNGIPNPTGGATYVLESWATLHRRFMSDIKGLFSKNELAAMIDVLHSRMLTPQFAGQIIEPSLHDSIQLDRLDKKWEFDPADLLAKIKSLTPDQLSHLEIWTNGYWETHPAVSAGDEMKTYISALV